MFDSILFVQIYAWIMMVMADKRQSVCDGATNQKMEKG